MWVLHLANKTERLTVNLLRLQSNHRKMTTLRFKMFSLTFVFVYLFLVSADEDCITKEITAKAPNIFKVVYPVPTGFSISNISLTQRHSFYMCELGNGFGYNSTHWWVSKGCDATFILTQCVSSDDNWKENEYHSGDLSEKGDKSSQHRWNSNLLNNLKCLCASLWICNAN